MSEKTHADRDWCVLSEGHEGICLADWEKAHLDKIKSFNNYRGRRLYACCALSDFESAIENLGIEDGSVLPQPDRDFNPRPSEQIRAELKNQARSLLRMILILNDGHVSEQKLNAF